MNSEVSVLGGVLRRENSASNTCFIHLDTGIKMETKSLVTGNKTSICLSRNLLTDNDIQCARDYGVANEWIKILEKEKRGETSNYFEYKQKEIIGIYFILLAIHKYFSPACKKISYKLVDGDEVEEHIIQYSCNK